MGPQSLLQKRLTAFYVLKLMCTAGFLFPSFELEQLYLHKQPL